MNEIHGLVISSIDYKEKSKIVYLYTPYGHDSIKANHSKDLSKGLLGFTTTLNEVNYIKSSAKFPTLIEYNLVKSNFSLISSIDKISVIGVIIKIIQNIPNDTDHFKVFNFILDTINSLNTCNPKKVLAIFLIKMTYVFGVNPVLGHCINCGNTQNLFSFSISLGTVLCRSCSTNSNSNYLEIWKEYYQDKKGFDEYSNVDFDELLFDILKYYQMHVNIDLKLK